jgi:hypothetical protein
MRRGRDGWRLASKAWRFVSRILEDPRTSNAGLHDLIEIMVIGLYTVLCGGQYASDMELFAREKEAFLWQFLKLEKGSFSIGDSGRFGHQPYDTPPFSKRRHSVSCIPLRRLPSHMID